METYEEVMRRNEPKNYTVRWSIAGKPESAYAFESFEEADMFADLVRAKDYVENVLVLRSGRHPSSKNWTPTRREVKPVIRKPSDGVFVTEEAWKLPTGFVDGEADKHGPPVAIKTDNRVPARTNAEKGEWARNNSFMNRMIGI